MTFVFKVFEDLSKKIKFLYNPRKVIVILHTDLRIFMISRWILKTRNISDKSCRQSQNTHFSFNNCLPKIVPFKRKCGGKFVKVRQTTDGSTCLIRRTKDANWLKEN